jgi:HEAT repeat protein
MPNCYRMPLMLPSRAHALAFAVLLTGSAIAASAAPVPAKKEDPFKAAVTQLNNDNPMVRHQGVTKLGRLRDPRAIPHLFKLFKDENPYVRSGVINVLGRLRVQEAGARVTTALRSDKNAQVRQAAAVALAVIASPTRTQALIGALKDDALAVRYAAARALGHLHAVEAIDPLIALTQGEDTGGRQTAAAALGRIGSPKAQATLLALLDDKDKGVRREAVKALGALRSDASIEALKARLTDSDMEVRVHAVMSLGRLGDNSGENTALSLLKNEDAQIRTLAANALGAFGSKKVLPRLKQALQAEKQEATKNVIKYAVGTIKSRLGIEDKPSKKSKGKKK